MIAQHFRKTGTILSTVICVLTLLMLGVMNSWANTISVISTTVDPATSDLRFFHKNADGTPYQNVAQLNRTLATSSETVSFATNGGIFMEDLTPLGLYIESGKTIRKLNTVKKAFGNFYLQPNGVFALYTNPAQQLAAAIMTTSDYPAFGKSHNIRYATQSGPMLVIGGKLSPILLPDSTSRKYRNGVGLLPDGTLLFAKSRRPVTFYDFARHFQSQGATNALYLDGSISMHYDRNQNQTFSGGKYSVLIATVETIQD